MEGLEFETRIIQRGYLSDREDVLQFLKKQDLSLDDDVEFTVALLSQGEIVATGSFAERVLKSIAVDPQYQGIGLSNKIVSLLINEEYQRGRTHLFIYTKPENYNLFKDMGFYKIAEVPSKVVLLENNPYGLNKYTEDLKGFKKSGNTISSIVMNCNPFTLGHQFLVERAAATSDVVHLFVVWEDKSIFPSEVRYRLVKEGTKHLTNVVVHRGKDYIISNATFPSYFLKEAKDIVRTHALLDLTIFGQHIAPVLGINQRIFGEEPYCEVTREYNEAMKDTLPRFGIEPYEVPRLKSNNEAISASHVRKLLREDKLKEVKENVPVSTYDFLTSHEARSIIEKIKNTESRH